MVRAKAWTGSAWADVRVWNGTQWKAYVPPVYGSDAYVEEFYGGLNGWTGSGYSLSTSYPVLHSTWENSVAYVDQYCAPYGLDGKIYRQWAANEYVFEAPPSTLIRAQVAVWTSMVSGDAAEAVNRELSFYAEVVDSGGYVQRIDFPAVVHPVGGTNGWVTHTSTANYTTPANADKPVSLYLREFYVRFYGGGNAVPTNAATMRLHLAWARLIGPDGNALQRKTVDAVHALKVWNGTAWV
jgi:hypothetical protein